MLFANAVINVFTGVFDVTNCVSVFQVFVFMFGRTSLLFWCSCIRLFVAPVMFAQFCMV